MENRVSRQQKIYWTLPVVALITFALFETDILPHGGLTTYDTSRYITDTLVILLNIAIIPMSIKIFSAGINKVKGADEETFVNRYRRLSEIRMAVLFAVIMLNIGYHYATGSEGVLYCILADLIAYAYSFPREKEIEKLWDGQ